MKKILLILISLLCLSVVFAQSDINTPKAALIGETLDLKAYCRYDGAECNHTISSCTVSIIDNKDSVLLNKVTMLNQTNYYNYSVTFSNSGEYNQITTCCQLLDCQTTYNKILIFGENVVFEGQKKADLLIHILFLAVGLCLLILFIWNRNVVFGYTAGVVLLLEALVIWVAGISYKISNIYDLLVYYNVPVLFANGLGFALVVFSVWLFWYSSVSRKEDELDIEYENETEN